jgi:thioredoxin 1
MSEHTTEITGKNFESFIKKGTVAIDFWAAWCGPCKLMGPIFEHAAKEMHGKASFGKLDVDAHTELAQEFGIMSIPTIVVFKDGELVDQVVGVITKDELIRKVKEHL